jgi:phenylacetate-CoA ligase
MANDSMALHVETAQSSDALKSRMGEVIRDITKLRGEVVWAVPGSLANDGKVIEDARSYQ